MIRNRWECISHDLTDIKAHAGTSDNCGNRGATVKRQTDDMFYIKTRAEHSDYKLAAFLPPVPPISSLTLHYQAEDFLIYLWIIPKQFIA